MLRAGRRGTIIPLTKRPNVLRETEQKIHMPSPTSNPKLDNIHQLIASAEANLLAAKRALAELTGAAAPAPAADYTQPAQTVGQVAADGREIEGVFDGNRPG